MSALGHKRTYAVHKAMSALPPIATAKATSRKRSFRKGLGMKRMSALGQKQTYAAQKVMSALPPKADMCGATKDVRFGPIADISLSLHSITLSAAFNRPKGMVRPSVLAVLTLITNVNLAACSTGMLAGLPPLRIALTKTAERRHIARKSAP
jgi:hypothetical protein